MQIPRVLIPATIYLIVTAVAPAHAQLPNSSMSVPHIDATGQVEIEQLPSRLRMRIELLAKASDLKTALQELNTLEAEARKQLAAQGVEKDSITLGTPQLSDIQSDTQRQIMQMMQSQLELSGRGSESNDDQPQPVTVSIPLTAEWAITTETIEDTLLWTRELETAIREADLSGANAATALTPEEEELMEEAMDEYAGYGYYGAEEHQPGDPVFLYVTSFSDEQLDTAMAKAFQKAKRQATRTANAAGKQAGDLLLISSEVTASDDYDPFVYEGFGYSDYAAMLEPFGKTTAADGSDTAQAVTAIAGPAKAMVMVMASFELK